MHAFLSGIAISIDYDIVRLSLEISTDIRKSTEVIIVRQFSWHEQPYLSNVMRAVSGLKSASISVEALSQSPYACLRGGSDLHFRTWWWPSDACNLRRYQQSTELIIECPSLWQEQPSVSNMMNHISGVISEMITSEALRTYIVPVFLVWTTFLSIVTKPVSGLTSSSVSAEASSELPNVWLPGWTDLLYQIWWWPSHASISAKALS